jgi:phospholipid/cholesterol/gamma-HCH transport system substrate-binding protein
MRRVWLAAVSVLAVAGAIAAVTVDRGETPYRMSLVFADAGGLREGGDIRVRGIRAGRIDAVELTAGDRALVHGHLFEGVGPLRAGASASSRPTGLLGEQYVDLALGRGARRPSGARIALARTGKAVSLSDVLDVLDAPTRTRLQVVIADAGVGLAGRGGDVRRLLAALPDTTRQLDLVVQQLRRRRAQLRRLIGRSDELLTPVAGRREDLGAMADAASGALRVAASRRSDLAKTVYRAPAALARLSTTVSALGDTAQQLRPTARQLTATAPEVERVLAALPAFRRDVHDVLATAERVSPRITRFARTARRPVRRLDRVAGGLGSFASTIAPIVDVLGDGGTNQLLRFFDGFSQIMEERDGIGNLIRIRGILGPMSGAASSASRGRRAPRRPMRDPGGTPRAPAVSLPSLPSAPLPAVRDVLPRSVPSVGKAVDDVLDFLLEP